MADIRIKDLPTTATQTASDDFIALDGTVNGTRKIDASAPSFKTSVTSPSVVAPATTPLTLTGGSTGASLVLGSGNNLSSITTPSSKSATLSFGSAGSTVKAYAGTFSNSGYFTSNWYYDGGQVIPFSNYSTAGISVLSSVSANGSLIDFLIGTVNTAPTPAARITGTGNLLIGTTTDAASLAGGLVVNGSGAGATASSTVTGALRVTGGVGVSGAGYFGGVITAGSSGNTSIGDTSLGVSSSNFVNYSGDSNGGVIASSNVYLDATVLKTAKTHGSLSGSAIYMPGNGVTGLGEIQFFANTVGPVTAGAAYAGTKAMAISVSKVNVPLTTPASSSIVGALTIGNGTAATNVAIGAGAIVAGGGITSNGGSAIGVNGFLSGNYYRLIENQADSTNGGGIIQTLLAGTWTNTLTMTHTGNATLRNALTVSGTTPSTGVGSGALQVAGGIYAGAASVFGGTVSVSASQPVFALANTGAGGGTWVSYVASSTGRYTLQEAGVQDWFTVAKTTGAATFAGAVTAAGPGFVSSGNGEIALIAQQSSSIGRIQFKKTAATAQTWQVGVSGNDLTSIAFCIDDAMTGATRMKIAATTGDITFGAGATTFGGTISPQQATTAGAPAYVKGAIYFDTTLNKLRVGGATAWETITSA